MLQGKSNATTGLVFDSDRWEGILVAARREGRVVAYANSVEQVNARLRADFQDLHPHIELDLRRVFGRPILDKLEAERDTHADGADVAITELIPWLEARAQEGALKRPCGPAVSEWPAHYLLHDSVPVLALDMFVIAYNRNLVVEPIAGYRDFLRPALKGRFSAPVLSSTAEVAWYHWLAETEGEEFLARFAAQAPRQGWKLGALPATRAVAEGELAATPFSLLPIARPMQDAGAPIEIVVPKPSMGLRFSAGVPRWSHRPNAGLVFLDYLMSRRGQAAWCGKGRLATSASPLEDISGPLDAATINAYDAARFTPQVVREYRAKWEALFGTYPEH